MLENGDFYGLPTHVLANDFVRLEYLAEAGPRIVRLALAGQEENLLAEAPDVFWETPYGRFNIRGGHRLWHAPEKMARTYIPDNEGLRVTPITGGVRLEAPREPDTALVKTMTITLDESRPVITIEHSLRNEGVWPVECAPWAITQMRLGGTAVLPQQVGQLDEDGLLPNRQLTLWPYTHWNDPRLHLHDDFIFVGPEVVAQPFKIGCFNRQGWLAYSLGETLFVKQFQSQVGLPHPDFGCNAEIYANEKFVELESLGPLAVIAPGETIHHTETWQLHPLTYRPQSLADLRTACLLVSALAK
jgi:hypothetical protein